MNSLDIKINITQLKRYNVSLRHNIDNETLLLMIESFSRYVMDLYIRLIEEAINSNRYRGQWEPIDDEGYLEYLGLVPENDILVYIRDALEVKKIGYNFVIRINPRKRYPGTNIPLSRVILAIDNGTSKFNGRPILRKIINMIRSHILDLYRGYLIMKGIL